MVPQCAKDNTRYYSVEQRTWLVEQSGPLVSIQWDFTRKWPYSSLQPSKQALWKMKKKLITECTVENLHRGRSGRPRSIRTETNIRNIAASLYKEKDLRPRDRHSSARKNNFNGISKSSFNRITKDELQLHPYKLSFKSDLKTGDYSKRNIFAQKLLQHIDSEDITVGEGRWKTTWSFLNGLWITDEATFDINGRLSGQNIRCYDDKDKGRPKSFWVPQKKFPIKIMVWGAVAMDGRKTDLVFFSKKNGSLDGTTYREKVLKPATRQIKRLSKRSLKGQCFMQDGAPCHTTRQNMKFLKKTFGCRFMSRFSAKYGGLIDWPPNSPDLSVLDFSIWSLVKQYVYASPMPNNEEELVDKIKSVWDEKITPEYIRSCAEEFVRRLRQCVADEGSNVD